MVVYYGTDRKLIQCPVEFTREVSLYKLPSSTLLFGASSERPFSWGALQRSSWGSELEGADVWLIWAEEITSLTVRSDNSYLNNCLLTKPIVELLYELCNNDLEIRNGNLFSFMYQIKSSLALSSWELCKKSAIIILGRGWDEGNSLMVF